MEGRQDAGAAEDPRSEPRGQDPRRFTIWTRTARTDDARALWAGSHLESFVARSAREESDLGAQAMCKLAMGGQRGIWMGAAKAEEARRRVRTSAVAPPCVRLEGGAAIIRGSVRP